MACGLTRGKGGCLCECIFIIKNRACESCLLSLDVRGMVSSIGNAVIEKRNPHTRKALGPWRCSILELASYVGI